MDIIVGREPVNNRLLISAGGKTGAIGQNGSVPISVSRNIDGSGHCRITIDDNGGMVITNIKPQNITYVDGEQVESKKIQFTSKVELGMSHYAMSVTDVMKAVNVLLGYKAVNIPGETSGVAGGGAGNSGNGGNGQAGQGTYSIAHLESVWKNYERSLEEMQEKQSKKAAIQSLQGILSMCGTMCIFIPGLESFRAVIIGAALLLALFFFWQRYNTSNLTSKEKKRITDDFESKYVCPNPACKCFKGNIKYISLKNQLNCPVCKCKYTC